MKIKLSILCSAFLLVIQSTSAQVKLPQLVSDNMVLQRNTKLNIWGWAQPGEKVSIKFNRKIYKTTTKPDGKWLTLLPAMKSGGPYSMEISASNHIVIHNILIGDVWFCAGQSNMVLPMERVKERYPEDISTANYPMIRNFFIPTISDVINRHDDLPLGKWQTCDPKNVLQFGAASYFFARKLYEEYQIPIGIINSSVGGTPIQAWISEDGLKNIPDYARRLVQLKDTAYVHRLQQQALNNGKDKPDAKTDKGLSGTKTWFDPTYVAANWQHFWLPGYWADQGVRGLNGSVWFRKEINVPESMSGKPAKLFMGRIVDADNLYVNGKFIGRTTYQYPPRRYQLPEGLLKSGKNIIVVQVINNSGKGGFVPDKPYFLTDGKDTLDLRGDWQYKVGQVFRASEKVAEVPFSAQNEPTGLYNTMVAPVTDYAVKGILWYQGEANTDKPGEYKLLLRSLIADWRKKWQLGDIPFVYAQLPNFMEVQYSPSESRWAELRQAQLEVLATPNTAMAVTIDAGEWNDIHPLNKKAVGERLALAAEKTAYQEKGLVTSGPIYQSAKVLGSKIILTFNSIGTGLLAKGADGLKQFSIAAADGKFVWAEAQIKGDKVEVWSSGIGKPAFVRYAWADNPEGANLYNKEGLPASPFTTEKP